MAQSGGEATKTKAEKKEARREANRRWRAANPEKAKESDRRYKTKNREKIRAAARRRYAENPEKAREASRRHREANPEDPERNRERVRKWAENRRAAGLCIRCGEEPAKGSTLREGSGICRPCWAKQLLRQELRRRGDSMAAKSDLFEAMLGALSSGDSDLAASLTEEGAAYAD